MCTYLVTPPLLPLVVVGVRDLLTRRHLVVPAPQELAHHLLRNLQGSGETPPPDLLLNQEAATVERMAMVATEMETMTLRQAMFQPGNHTTGLPISNRACGWWKRSGALGSDNG